MFFAACQEEPFVNLSESGKILEYKAGTVEITVDALGSWALEGSFDWITPSATSGASGDKLTFTYGTNLTGSICNAAYTVNCDGATATFTISQKSGSVDAVVVLNLGSMNDDGYHVVTYAGGIFVNNTFTNNHNTSGKAYQSFAVKEPSDDMMWELFVVNNIFVGNDTKLIDHTLEPGEFPSFEGAARNSKQMNVRGWGKVNVVCESNICENHMDGNENFKYNPYNTIIPLDSDLTAIFTDFGSDYTLKAGSIAVDAGSDLNEVVKGVLNFTTKTLLAIHV